MKKETYPMIEETVYTKTLKNGLTVHLIPKKEVEKSFGIFMTNYGSIDRHFIPLDKNGPIIVPDGIAHFLEHKLFEKEDRDVFDDFLSYGASPNAYTSFTKTAYLFSATSNIKENVETLLDFVQTPYFSDASVEKEKGIIEQEIHMYNDQPDSKLYMHTLENMYQSHLLRIDIAGTVESIQQITKEDLYTCYHTFYHPSNMVFTLIGNFEADELIEWIENNQTKKKFPPQQAIVREEIEEKEEVFIPYREIDADVSIPKVMLGIKHVRKQKDALQLLKEEIIEDWILDYFFSSSSEYYEVLYEKELVDESFEYMATAERDFHFTLFASNTLYPEQFIETLKEQLMDVQSCSFNEEDIQRMKRKWLGEYVMQLNSLEHIANEYCHYYFEGNNFFSLQEVANAITLSEVETFLKNWVSENRITICVLRKEKDR